ncbi:ABC transporter ATP-binding protein [Jiella endophytica]|uniref:ABC transporter ATP-binding protein n=1 Tax=Jiella endophytica TaxID=2558362 RepID=A0A4Y8R9F4_9HYPH|nr:ABC transporter ATP-binding protein [Jiella endophytica]TFF17858.1 ABC transporter ATP-binding protein [Jiella endophytica]
MGDEPLLEVRDLVVEVDTGKTVLPVIDGVSFILAKGRTLGIVGESGCGKSMTALAVMQLLPPGFRIASGEIRFCGEDLARVGERRLRALRGNDMSMIFQEPMTSLNPVYTVGDQIGETLRLHQRLGAAAARQRTIELLRSVHIPAAERRVDDYPHQLSGGMRQRVMIAMALACRPKLIIADEPTTALDVTVQAQIFRLLEELREETGTAIILITHDVGAVAEMADEVAVFYAGKRAEFGPVDTVLSRAAHPYTRGLMASTPRLRLGPAAAGAEPALKEIAGVVPPLGEFEPGCRFSPRCPLADLRCRDVPPPEETVDRDHSALCWKTGLELVA